MKAIVLTVALSAVLGACGTTDGNRVLGETMTDKKFGASVREGMARQTIDQDAGSKHANVKGDAGSAALALDRYERSYKEAKPKFKVLGIGDR